MVIDQLVGQIMEQWTYHITKYGKRPSVVILCDIYKHTGLENFRGVPVIYTPKPTVVVY